MMSKPSILFLESQMAIGVSQNVLLTLAQRFDWQGYSVALEQQAKRLDIQNRVTFLGMRQDVSLLLTGANVFVLPSISEGSSLALMGDVSRTTGRGK